MTTEKSKTLSVGSTTDLVEKPTLCYRISTVGDCSFCDKKSHQVRILFKGKYASICDECVELCKEIIDEDLAERTKQEILNNKVMTSNLACSCCTRKQIDPEVLLLIAANPYFICDICVITYAQEI